MERRVYIYDRQGKERGHVRLDTDEVGDPVAEVYDDVANKMGAIRWEMFRAGEEQAFVHDADGREIGHVVLRREVDGRLSGDVFFEGRAGTPPEHMAQVYVNGGEQGQFLKGADGSQPLGTLKPEQVSAEELVLVGGGAAFLILM